MSNYNYNELCRLCASYQTAKIDIFSDSGKKRKLKEKIQICLPLQVSEGDNLPRYLCFKCIFNLDNFYLFRKGCVEAVNMLKVFATQAMEAKARSQQQQHFNSSSSNSAASLSMVHNLLPQVSITLKTVDSPEDTNNDDAAIADILNPEVVMQNGNGNTDEMNGDRNDGDVIEDDEGGDDEDSNYPMNFLELNVDSQDSNDGHISPAAVMEDESQNGSAELIPCPICGKVFPTRTHLLLHTSTTHGVTSFGDDTVEITPQVVAPPRPHSCDLCGKTYTLAKHLWGHVKSAHQDHPSVTCNVCARTFSTISNLVEHKRSRHGIISNLAKNPLKRGSEVGSVIPSKVPRNNDSSTDVSIENRCMLCTEKCSSTEQLNLHIQIKHGIDPTQLGITPISNEEIRKKEALDSEGGGLQVFTCEICTREFGDRASLWLHMVHGHKEEAALSCGNCLKVFTDNLSLLRHVEEKHPTVQRRYSCQVCGRQHDSRKKLMKHVAIHNLFDENGQPLDPSTVINTNNQVRRPSVFHSNSGVNIVPPGVPQVLTATITSEKTFGCQLCSKLFPSEEILIKHIQQIHSSGNFFEKISQQYSCEICGSTHSTRTDRWNHIFEQHNGHEKITCPQPQCRKVFVSSLLTIEHKSHHEEQGDFPHTCEICGKMWKSRVEYFKHMMGVHPYCVPHICGVCLKIFLNVPDLREHVKTKHHPFEHDHACDVCGRPYAKRSKMARHRLIHKVTDEIPLPSYRRNFKTKAEDLKCEICPDVEFENIDRVKDHRRILHSMFVCEICPKYYSRSTHLWKHVNRVHKGHPDVTCPVCGKVSSSKVHLEKHMFIHENPDVEPDTLTNEFGEDLPQCDLCQRQFKLPFLLRKHQRSCKGPRRVSSPLPEPDEDGIFRCKKCPKGFINPNIYRKHLRITHIKSYCELCPSLSGFDSKVDLLTHIKTEHKDTELKCDVEGCTKFFRTFLDCFKHKREHKGVGVRCPSNYCDFCADVFSNRKKLWLHLKTTHKNMTGCMCAVCFIVADDLKALEEHVATNHQAMLRKPFVCRICARSLGNGVKIAEHIKIHGDNLMNCRMCGYIVDDEEKLKEHLTEHANMPPETPIKPKQERRVVFSPAYSKPDEIIPKRLRTVHTCNLCHRTYRQLGDLMRHKEEEHDLAVSTEFCFTCDTQYGSAEEFKEHHCTAMNKSIEELNTSEESEPTLSNRRRTWGDDTTPVACDICKKEWPSKKYLWQHLIRTHKAEAGLACGICLKITSSYDDMFIHIDEKHLGYFSEDSNTFTCKVCGRYHNASPKLASHVSVHAGLDKSTILLHQCTKCDFLCKTEKILKKHIDSHDEELDEDDNDDEENLDDEDDEIDDDDDEDDDEEEDEDDDEDEEDEIVEPIEIRTVVSEEDEDSTESIDVSALMG